MKIALRLRMYCRRKWASLASLSGITTLMGGPKTLFRHTRGKIQRTLLNTIELLKGAEILMRLTEKRIRALQVWMFALTLGIAFLVWNGLHH